MDFPLASGVWMSWAFWLMAPTFGQPFIQKKLFKVIARLGAGVFSGCFGVVVTRYAVDSRWWIVGELAVGYYIVFRFLLWLRKRYTHNPCDSCPLGTFPTCTWNMGRLLQGADDTLRKALISGKIEVFEDR